MVQEKLPDLLMEQLEEIGKVGDLLWKKGWAERNGGNLSVRLDRTVLPRIERDRRFVPVDGLPARSGGMILYCTGAGMRLRDCPCPEKVGALIEISSEENGYDILWGGAGPDFRATSELSSHLLIHCRLAEKRPSHRAVLHTHPTELIALSHHPVWGTDEKELTRLLWSMLPEVRAFVPRGIAVVPYLLPGSLELAQATIEALERGDVALWEKHGACATGKNLESAFDYIDVANKGAQVLCTALSAGFTPVGLSQARMDEISRVFKLPG